MSVYFVCSIVVVCCSVITLGLQCFQCGQYNDGVGSITPCINYTHMQIKDCPNFEQTYCIKYVSEGTTIRDCVQKCVEKETWGTRTYCCREDGCNSSSITRYHFWLLALCTLLIYKMSH